MPEMNGAQMLIENAFQNLLTGEQKSRYAKAGGTKWADGEAEEWLRDIADGRYQLDVNIGIAGVPNPVLTS